MDSINLNKELKQSLTANELANILEAGCSKDQGAVPKYRKGSPAKTGTQKPGLVRQDPTDLKKFRPPLGRTGAATSPAPKSGNKKDKNRNFAKAEKGSPFYVPTSADFEDDKPGGRKDKNLRQLSGAQMKWYRRALLEGETPEAALAKAKHRGSSQAAPKVKDAGKRELSEDSKSTEARPYKFSRTMEGSTELRKPVHKPQQKPQHETAEGSFGMAILDANYPSKLMEEEEMKEVESFLIKKVVEGWTSKIRIHNLKLGPGYITLRVEDSQTAAWLRQAIWAGNTALKKNLKVVEGTEVPQARLITMFLPRAEDMSREDILKAIKSSNELDTERWQVISDAPAKDKEGKDVGKTLKALIDEHQQKKLADAKHVIHFLFSSVNVYGARSAQTTTSTGPKPEEGLSQSPTADPVLDTAEAGSEIEMLEDTAAGGEDITVEEETLLLSEEGDMVGEPEGKSP